MKYQIKNHSSSTQKELESKFKTFQGDRVRSRFQWQIFQLFKRTQKPIASALFCFSLSIVFAFCLYIRFDAGAAWQKIENKFALPLVVVGECDKN